MHRQEEQISRPNQRDRLAMREEAMLADEWRPANHIAIAWGKSAGEMHFDALCKLRALYEEFVERTHQVDEGSAAHEDLSKRPSEKPPHRRSLRLGAAVQCSGV